MQSPIAIDPSTVLKPTVATSHELLYTRLTEGEHSLKFSAPDKVQITNTGYTLRVTPIRTFFGAKDFGSIDLPAGTFIAKEFQFHFPAEHKIVASAASAPEVGELQIMFKDEQTHGYVGLSILLRAVESTSSMFQRHADFFTNLKFKRDAQDVFHLGSGLPSQPGDSIVVDKKINLDEAFTPDVRGSYFHYTGSLTTPPCTEGVHWYVVQAPVNVTWSLLQNAKDAILEAGMLQAGGNNRALQPSQGRKVILDALATDKTDPVFGASAATVAPTSVPSTTAQMTMNSTATATSTIGPDLYAGGSSGASYDKFDQPSSGSSSVTTFTVLCVASGCCFCLLASCCIAVAVKKFGKSRKSLKRKEYFPPLDLEEEEEEEEDYDPLTQTALAGPLGEAFPLNQTHYNPAEAPVAVSLERTVYTPSRPVAATGKGYVETATAAPASSYYQRPAFSK